MDQRTRKEKNNRDLKKMKCETCKKEYSPKCDYRQGRCPHHPKLLEILSDKYKMRFYNLLNVIRGKK